MGYKKSCLLALFLLVGVSAGVAQPVSINPHTLCPPITPAWAFGHIVWEDSINTRRGAEMLVNGYLERGYPVDAIIIDSPWSTSYNSFEWDTQRYVEPQAMISGFMEKGVRTILWLTGFVNEKCKDTAQQKSSTFDEVAKKRFGADHSRSIEWWKGKGIHLDFTSQEATEWWYGQLDKVFTEGVYGWKVDQGDVFLPPFFDTSRGEMSNQEFRHFYYDAMFDYTVGRRPDGVTIARPYSWQRGQGAITGQESSIEKLNMGWCGDFSGSWDGLQRQINDIYQSARHGYGAIGCEVGGFAHPKSTAIQFIRYAQFGCMTAFMINGGENGPFSAHLPWTHGQEIEKAYRWCVEWMKSLTPYKFSTVVDAHLHGGSLIKGTNLEEKSHMLGNDIFTKAITQEDGKVIFHLPDEGEWIDYWTGKAYPAGAQVVREYSVSEFPLFVRSGAIIPMSDASMPGKCVFRIYPNGKSVRHFHLPKGSGTEYFDCTVAYDEKKGRVTVDSEQKGDFIFMVGKKRISVAKR